MQNQSAKNEKITLPARASLWYTVTGALERASAFLFTPILTRMLTPEEFGLYPLYVSWMGIFTVFCTLEISGSVIYKGLSKFKSKDDFLSSALFLMSISSIVFFSLYLLFSESINSLTGLTNEITYILFLQIFLTGAQSIYLSKCKYLYKYRTVALLNILFAVASPLITVVLINLTRLRADARIFASLLVSIILTLPLIITIFKRGRIFVVEIWKFILKFTLPLLPHFLALTVIAQSGKIITASFFGESELGKYSVALSLGFCLNVLTGGIHSALHPWINRKLISGRESAIEDTVMTLFLFVGIIILLFLSFAPELLDFIAPKEYASALIAIYPVALSVLFSFFSNIIYSTVTFYEKTYLATAASISSALISLLLNLGFTARLGFVSASVILCLSSIILLVFNFFALKLLTEREIFSPKKLCMRSAFIIAFSIPIYALRETFIARLLIAIALLILLLPRLPAYKALATERIKA